MSTVGHGQILTVDGLGHRFGPKWLFRGLSFELRRGDCLVVTGSNGSGKSTLIRILAGLIHPTEGAIRGPGDDPRRSIGLSTLESSLYPELTGIEHLNLTGDLRGVHPHAWELLKFVGLDPTKTVPVKNFSSGMKSRLRLAIAIQAAPPILLLDEPGASLDQAGRELVASIVHNQKTRGCLILATNDPLETAFATHRYEVAK